MERFTRRRVVAGLAHLPWAGAALSPLAAWADAPQQADWRFCGKCSVMFFDGFPDKAHCAGGGGHQAIGLNFTLPHDTPETPKAQANWRFCGKCHGLFFDGFPQKGACPGGGGHQSVGFNFTLPHDVAETPKAQANWRFCGKCEAMYFDGFADNKGKCQAGGAHAAAGFNFVLPNQGDPFANALDKMWRDAGRGIVAEQIRDSINGHTFQKGVSGKEANVALGDLFSGWRRTGPTSLAIDLRVPGSNVEFKTTTDTILGSFADPSFRVGFDLALGLICLVQPNRPFLVVNVFNAAISNASVHGSNASGTLVETIGDFLSHGGFSQRITSQINDDKNIKDKLQAGIDNAVAGLNAQIPG